MMNTLEIELILKNISPVFKGVYARNRLPHNLDTPCSLICNTDPDTEQGQHWIAVYIDKERHGEYYDPYGLPPFHFDFVDFLNRQCNTWSHNPIRVQHLNSLVCGQHCIYYLVHRENGMRMNQITENLRIDLYTSTLLVDDFVRNLVHYLL